MPIGSASGWINKWLPAPGPSTVVSYLSERGWDVVIVPVTLGANVIVSAAAVLFASLTACARLPAPLEFVLNTPSHHRVHHGSNDQYLDKNYGGILIIWDRLFGSYAHETHRPTYGLTKNLTSNNPVRLQYYEYGNIARDVRRATSWRERLGYVFAPPGWQPDPAQKNARFARWHQSSTAGQEP